jgi:hypothetical protein
MDPPAQSLPITADAQVHHAQDGCDHLNVLLPREFDKGKRGSHHHMGRLS